MRPTRTYTKQGKRLYKIVDGEGNAVNRRRFPTRYAANKAIAKLAEAA